MPVVLRELLPGVPPVFDCKRLRASLTLQACETNYRKERYHQCLRCPIGRENAGLPVELSEVELQNKCCIRCQRRQHRLVRDLCVSCINRQYEIVRGANAKGAFPSKVAAHLSLLTARVTGEVLVSRRILATGGSWQPQIRTFHGGACVRMLSTGPDEFRRWLGKRFPRAELVDFEMVPCYPPADEPEGLFGRDGIFTGMNIQPLTRPAASAASGEACHL